MRKRFFRELICTCFASMLIGLLPMTVYAISEEQLNRFAQNNILYYDPGNMTCFDEADLEYDQERNASIVIGMLMEAGYTHDSALAIAGNIKRESSFNTRVIEGGKIVEDGWRAFENGAKTFIGGFGLVQWTTAGRVQRLQEYADENNLWVGTLRAQIGFMIEELSGSFGPDRLNAMSLEGSTWQIYRRYETPGSSFWTIHNGNYYNDYAPDSLSDLSETATPAAWRAYHARLNAAKNLADLEPTQLSGSCAMMKNDGTLASIAVSMAWPNADGTCNDGGRLVDWTSHERSCRDDVKPEYRQAMLSVNGGHEPGSQGRCPEKGSMGYYQDCGHFVATVVRYSGLDPDFPRGGTSNMLSYMAKSEKWMEIPNLGNTTNLEPGDIFVVRGTNRSGEGVGHIMMYTGDYSPYGNLAEASWCYSVANMHKVHFTSWGYNYRIFRFVGGTGERVNI